MANEKSMHDLFIEDSKMVEKAFRNMKSALTFFMKGKVKEANEWIEKTIAVEKEQDRLRETVLERLFGKETMVFSRPDRINIIEELDDIVDNVEMVVRYLRQYEQITVPEDLKAGFLKINDILIEIGIKVNLLIQNILRDFEKAKPICSEIEDLRRKVREHLWKLSDEMYEIDLDYKQFNYFQNLINSIRKTADESEDFADKMYGLLCKYAM